MSEYINIPMPQKNPHNNYGNGVLEINSKTIKDHPNYVEVANPEDVASIYLSEYMPDWYEPFRWTTDTWNSFPTLRNQWVYSDESFGRWGGTPLYSVGNCVAQAVATLMQIHQFLNTGNKNPYSMDWIYGNRKDYHWQGYGMYIGEALDCLASDGVPYYSDLPGQHPYNEAAPNSDGRTAKNIVKSVKPTLINKARNYKIRYYGIAAFGTDVEYLKQHIMEDGGVIVDTGVTPAWYDIKDGILGREFDGTLGVEGYENYISSPSPGVKVDGYHALVLIGWKVMKGKLYWICWNNWGWWGDNSEISPGEFKVGLCYLPHDYPLIRMFYTVKPYNPPKPSEWNWTTSIVKGGNVYQTVKVNDITYTAYIIPSWEWNSFTNKINESLQYKGIDTFPFPTVSRDTNFTKIILNQAIDNINKMLDVSNKLNYVETVTAQIFIDMRDKLNSIT